MFLVDADTPGVKVVRHTPTMMGDVPCEIAPRRRDRAGPRNLIGREGDGMRAGPILDHLGPALPGLPAGLGGRARRCIDLAVSYAKQRVTFGRAARGPPGRAVHGSPTASPSITWRSSWSTSWRHATDARRGGAARKLHGEDRRHRARLSCRRPLHADPRGHGALQPRWPISKMWARRPRSFMITEGPVEVMRMVLAREIFRGAV